MTVQADATVYQRGLQLAEAGQHEQGLGCIRQYLQASPADAEALNDAGAILYCLGRYEEAIEHLERAQGLRADCGQILWNLVEAYLVAGRPEKTISLFDDMQRLGLLYPDILNRTADALLRQADKANAIEMLLWSLRLSPGQKVLEPMIELLRAGRPKITFFCGLKGDVKFLKNIYQFASRRYPVSFFEGGSEQQMYELMKSTDIAWFEWCTDMVVQASKLPKMCRNIVRLHRFEAYGNWMCRVQWENIDVLISVGNSFVKEAIIKQVPDIESRTRLVIIPNGVDLGKFKFADRGRGKNIACIGYLNMRKNPMLLLQCMQKLHYLDKDYRLFFAGDFQDAMLEQYIRYMVGAMGLSDVIIFDGWQEDIDRWLLDKHYIVSGSIGESQGMGVLEAMACGLKPVIHNFPGAEEVFSQEFLFNISEDFCRQVLSDSYEPREYRRFVEERYPLTKQLRSIDEIFVQFERQMDSSAGPAQVGTILQQPASQDFADTSFVAGPLESGHSPQLLQVPSEPDSRDFWQSDLTEPAGGSRPQQEIASLGWADTSGTGPIFKPQTATILPGAEPQKSAQVALDVRRKVLVEFNAVVGDVLCMEPAIRALKEQLGSGAEITVRTNHPELFVNHPSIACLEHIDSARPAVSYDQVFTLSCVASREVRGLHLVERAARQIGVHVQDRRPRIYLDSKDYQQIEKFHLPTATGPVVAVGPAVCWPCWSWSDEKWRRLCELVLQKFEAVIIQLDSSADCFLGRGLDLVGKTTIREAAAIISLCDLFVGTDDGLAHIAAAVGTPCVVLFGPVLPEKCMHPGPARAVVAPGGCRGCFHLDDWDQTPPRVCPKGHNECMEQITVEAVLAAVSEFLA
jgi:pentatricopeptide repeat protein